MTPSGREAWLIREPDDRNATGDPDDYPGRPAVLRGQCPDCGGPLVPGRQPVTIVEIYGVVAVLGIITASTYAADSFGPGGRGLMVCMQFPGLLLVGIGLVGSHLERAGLLCRRCGKYRLPPGVSPDRRPGPWPYIVAGGFLSLVNLILLLAGSHGAVTSSGDLAPALLLLLICLFPLLFIAGRGTARRVWSMRAPPGSAGDPAPHPLDDPEA